MVKAYPFHPKLRVPLYIYIIMCTFAEETTFTERTQHDMEQQEYLDNYEQNLVRELQKVCTQQNRLAGQLLPSPDLDEKWEGIAQAYLGDAVKEIAKYPTVALGWMMYVGMGAAHFWDEDGRVYSGIENLCTSMRDKRGFDYLDEYVRETVLGLKGADYDQMEEFVRICATLVLTQIRHEHVEPQSPLAFHVYVRSIHALFLIGSSMELYRLGYKMSAPSEGAAI